MLNLAAAVERARDFDIIHYEAAYYPMSLAFSRLSPTPILQTLHHAPSESEGRAVAAIPGGALHRDLARAGALSSSASTSSAPCCTASTPTASCFANSPTTTCSSSAVSPKARACCRPSRSRSASACGSSSPRPKTGTTASTWRRTWTARRSCTSAKRTSTRKVALYGGARALLYPVQAREPFGLVLAEAMACGTPVAALDRGAVREVVDEGVTGIVFDNLDKMAGGLDARVRSRSPARARARRRPFRRRPHGGRVRRRLPTRSWTHIVGRRRDTMALAGRARARGLRPPRRRIAGLRRTWRGSPTQACAWWSCARRAASAARRPARRDDALGPCGRANCASRHRAGRRRSHHPRSPGRRSAMGPTSPSCSAELVDCMRFAPAAVITFGDDGLYWHLDHVGVHERTTAAVRSLGADAPPLYYVTMPLGVMPAIVEHAIASGWTAPPKGFWSLAPKAFGLAAEPPTIVVDVGAWAGESWRPALPSQPDGRDNPFTQIDDDDARRWLRVRAFPPRRHRRHGRQNPCSNAYEHRAARHPALPLLRRAARARHVDVPPIDRRPDSRRHPRLPLLHLPVVDGIPVLHLLPAATAARDHIEAGRPGLALRRWSASRIEAAGETFEAAAASETSTYREIVEALGPELRRRLLPVSLLRSDVHRRPGRRARGCGRGAPREAARGRCLRRIRASHARPDGSVVAAAGARRPVFPEGLARAALHRAGMRAGLLRRQRAAAVRARRLSATRCARTRFSTSGPSGSSSASSRAWWTDPEPGAVVINHTHNQLTWSPSHGQPLSPAGYRDLFETMEPRIFGEAGLFADVVKGGPLDLSRRDSDGDP